MIHNKLAVTGIILFAVFYTMSFFPSSVSFVFCGISAAATAGAFFICRPGSRERERFAAVPFVTVTLTAAFLFFGIYNALYIESARSLCGGTYEMTAKAVSVTRPAGDTVLLTAEGRAGGIPVRFTAFIPDKAVIPGDTLDMTVRFSPMTATAAFDTSYSFSRGIFVSAAAKDVYIAEENSSFDPALIISGFSDRLKSLVRGNTEGDTGALLLAMFFGDKSDLSREFYENIRKAGLPHLTAVSGMHISLMITVLMAALEHSRLKSRRLLRFWTAVVLSAVFMVFFNMTASVRRSALMLIFYYGSLLFRRKSAPLNSLGAAAVLILLTEPCACRDAGLILSVCGTFGAAAAAPEVCRLLGRRIRLNRPAKLLVVSICASICTLPVSALTFGGVSVLSAVTSAAVYPFFYAAMVFMLLFAVTGGALTWLLVPAQLAVFPLQKLTELLGKLPFGYVPIDEEMMRPLSAVSALFIAAVYILSKRKHSPVLPTALSCLLSLCVLTGAVTAEKLTDHGRTRIYIYSDGNDALAAVSTPAGTSIFLTDISRKLCDRACSLMTDLGLTHYDLLCVTAERGHREMYSRTLYELPVSGRLICPEENSSYSADGFTAEVSADSVTLDINGCSVYIGSVTDKAGQVYDIAVLTHYRSAAVYGGNAVTVLCDSRYDDVSGAYSAYYHDTHILIDPSGKYVIKYR